MNPTKGGRALLLKPPKIATQNKKKSQQSVRVPMIADASAGRRAIRRTSAKGAASQAHSRIGAGASFASVEKERRQQATNASLHENLRKRRTTATLPAARIDSAKLAKLAFTTILAGHLPPHLVFKPASDVRRLCPAPAEARTRLTIIFYHNFTSRFSAGFKRGAAPLRGCSKEQSSFEYTNFRKRIRLKRVSPL